MQLYAERADRFTADPLEHKIALKLSDAWFEYYRYKAGPAEVASWENSLYQLAAVIQNAELDDVGVTLELHLPQASKRLDCILTGRDNRGRDSAVLIELKQWTAASETDLTDFVVTFAGKGEREVEHPCVQAGDYATWLRNMSEVFYEANPMLLHACAFLHNMHESQAYHPRSEKFKAILADVPLFVASDLNSRRAFLNKQVGNGDGVRILERLTTSKSRPSKSLMQSAAKVIKGAPIYRLLDEQLLACEMTMRALRKAKNASEHSVVLIRGGPGTGKSVIAVQCMARFLGMGIVAEYATGSRAFTETFWFNLGSKLKPLSRYTHHFAHSEPLEIDVLIVDEAHRIRESSNTWTTPKSRRSAKRQIDEILDASKVAVFMLDDHQAVRPGEVGRTELILEAAAMQNRQVYNVDLTTQFRSAGSEEYVDWLDDLFGIRSTPVKQLGKLQGFDFRVVSAPEEAEAFVKARANEGYNARMMAGFCWKWSAPNSDGTLVDDVRIGDYARPWDARYDARKLAPGIPKASLWATMPSGINQVGCVCTAQGFEFDYAGVIVGRDLVVRGDEWIGQMAESCDSAIKRGGVASFTDCVTNAYRILLTRGLKGCVVCFLDDETKQHFISRMLAE